MAVDANIFSSDVTIGGKQQTVILQRNAEQAKKIEEKLRKDRLGSETAANEARIKEEYRLQEELARAETRGNKKKQEKLQEALKKLLEDRKKYEEKLKGIQAEAEKYAQEYERHRYESMSVEERAAYDESVDALKLKVSQELVILRKRKQELLKIQSSSDPGSDAHSEAATELGLLEQQEQDLTAGLTSVVDELVGFSEIAAKDAKNASSELKKASADYTKAEKELAKKRRAYKQADDAYDKAKKGGDPAEIAAAKANREKAKEELKEAEESAKAALKAKKTAQKEAAEEEETIEDKRKRRLDSAKKAADGINKIGNAIETTGNTIFERQGKMEGRLQGLDSSAENKTWQKAVDLISKNVGYSYAISQKNIISKMEKLVDSGVAYNLELRAYLAEATETIAATFNAFDSNLLRLIRIQQEDSTAARLGMEAALTKFLNENFQDTSYLASDILDTVAGTLLDASANMTTQQAVAFENVVQKWLASLYSLGASQQTVTSLAQGLNYLGSGNLSQMSQNSPLMMLFSMGASRTGKSLTDMLNSGMNAEDTNLLLKSIVTYLAEIAESQTTNVTKSAYADLFGISVTDLNIFSTANERIDQIYSETITSYEDFLQETSNQLNNMGSRLNFAQQLTNVLDNATTSAVSALGPMGYSMYKVFSTLEAVGDIAIPGIQAAGFGTASEIPIFKFAKAALTVGGLGLGLLGSLGKGFGMDNDLSSSDFWGNWNASTSSERGRVLPALKSGFETGLSYSAQIGTISNDIQSLTDATVLAAEDSASKYQESSEQAADEQQKVQEDIRDSLTDGNLTAVSLLSDIRTLLDPTRVFYTAIAGTLTSEAASNLISLSAQLTTSTVASTTTDNSENSKFKLGSNDIDFVSDGRIFTDGEQEMWTQIIANAIKEALSGGIGGGVTSLTGLFGTAIGVLG